MKQEIIRRPGYTHFMLKFGVPFTNFQLQFHLKKTPKMKTAQGIVNRLDDGKFVLFLDYDDMRLPEIEKELIFLAKEFLLGPCHIFQLDRPDSFHVVCADRINLFDLKQILDASTCDLAFKHAPEYFKRSGWILRISKKGERGYPEYLKTIRVHDRPMREESAAIKTFLAKYYNVPTEPNERDIKDKMQFVEYETASRVR